MKQNIFFNFLTSLPIILLCLYFIPFLGVCLLLVKFFRNSTRKSNISTSIIIIVFGFVILFPKISNFILDGNSFFESFINTSLYNVRLIEYSKNLITIGVLYLLFTYLFEYLKYKFHFSMLRYILNLEKKNATISLKNDLIMKEKREKAKNTKVIYCPFCGADNLLTSKTGTCKYCRKQIKFND